MPKVQEAPTLEFGEATRSMIDPQISQELASQVNAALPERAGQHRRLAFLFRQDATDYIRVNFQKALTIDSFWVTVTDGVATVSPESNRPFKADGK